MWDPWAWQGPADDQRGSYQQPGEAHPTWWSHRLGEAKAGLWRHWWVQQVSDCWAPVGSSSRKIDPARGASLSDQPNAWNHQPNPSWRHHAGRMSAHPLSQAGGHTCERPHCDRDGYLDPYSGPDWWRIRWKRCDPTATPVRQGWSSRVGQALGCVLTKLAGKAAAALPGIIGSIVSWLLSTMGEAAGWLAEHVWALAVVVGGLLFLAARELLVPHEPKWH